MDVDPRFKDVIVWLYENSASLIRDDGLTGKTVWADWRSYRTLSIQLFVTSAESSQTV
jgi:hypothetical protein